MRKKVIALAVLFAAAALDGYTLPSIPGCPLHESCVRALKQEQRNRQRSLKRRETPDAETGGTLRGVYLGFQTDLGDLNDSANDYINLRVSAGYLNSFGNIDLFGGVFYTFAFDDPGLSPVAGRSSLPLQHRGGLEANLAYHISLSETFTLAVALDSWNQFNVIPNATAIGGNAPFSAYAVLEPALCLVYALPFGEADVSSSFPLSYADDKALDYTLSFSLNTDAGLGLTANLTWQYLWAEKAQSDNGTIPPFSYGQTEIVARFWRGAFFASLAATADGGFTRFGLEPYAAYTIRRITLFASVLLTNLGAQPDKDTARLNLIQGKRDITSVIPSVGMRVRF
jgi:hypothetical protein